MSKMKIAISITTIWIALGAISIFCGIEEFKKLKPNEIGDFLSGFFSPIAFMWLVVGYFQQGEELQLNTKALELQVNELKLSVKQQKELVDITRAEMALSKEALDREKAKEVRQSQPIFSLQANQYNSSQNSIHALEATLINNGNEATSIKLSCPEGKILQNSIAVIARGQSMKIHFQFQKNPVSHFLTKIEYVDGLGIFRKVVISAVFNEQNSLVFLSPVNELEEA